MLHPLACQFHTQSHELNYIPDGFQRARSLVWMLPRQHALSPSHLAAAVDNFQGDALHSEPQRSSVPPTFRMNRSLLKAKLLRAGNIHRPRRGVPETDAKLKPKHEPGPKTRTPIQSNPSQVKTHSTTVSHNCKFKWK